jgi:hypothetical protein
LSPFEVTVGGGGADLSALEFVGVHGETHGTSGFAPFKSGGDEDLVESFGFGLLFDSFGTGDDKGFDSWGDMSTLGDFGGFA